MDYTPVLQETIGVSDRHHIETELDAIIYRNEFEKFRSEYLNFRHEETLIFLFIFLQIYVECFLHQHMRIIIELEFKSARTPIFDKWMAKERRYLPEKLDDFSKLFELSPSESLQLIAGIKERFGHLSDIRNQFAHGHKIAAWSDSEGNSGMTTARTLLTDAQLTRTEKEVNELGIMWNELLDQIQPKCNALRRIDNFKFQNI